MQVKKNNFNCVSCQKEFIRKTTTIYCSPECKLKHKEQLRILVREKNNRDLYEKNKHLTGASNCQICGFKSHRLFNHIHNTHNITTEEYRQQFPNQPLVSKQHHQQQSERVKGDRNPAYQHGGKFSPFSKKFCAGFSADVFEKCKQTKKENSSDTTKLSYYIAKGMSEEDAKIALSKRQTTFSLNKCIEKYGQEEGTKRWQKRQEKWLNTLNNKSPEERAIINQKKMNANYCISKAEQELCSLLIKNGFNIETQKIIQERWIYDICFNNKIIEYHGDYWHCNPKKYNSNYYHKKLQMTAQEKWKLDNIKKNHAVNHNYEYLIIWENDYKQNPEQILQECICFLTK